MKEKNISPSILIPPQVDMNLMVPKKPQEQNLAA